MKGVARRLNTGGVRMRAGKLWSGNQVKYVLTSPVYAGANVYGRHRKGDTRLSEQSEWSVVAGMRTSLVASALLFRVRHILGFKAGRRAASDGFGLG